MSIARKESKRLQKNILTYYKEHKRPLPWRKTTDAYAILLSEIMLQQTQVERVKKYYLRWLERWPKIEDLAQAQRKDVLSEWIGLGYNNRAIRLHEAAKIIVEKYNSDVLKAMHEYKNIPGIGPYTAAAVRIFADNQDIVTIDTNIRRILIHELGLKETIPDKELWEIAEQCLPKGRSREWHNALMDYGAMHLTARKSGIRPKTIQSRFEGSDRQLRAKIVRLLLKTPRTFKALTLALNSSESKIDTILKKLEKDNLVFKKGKTYKIKN